MKDGKLTLSKIGTFKVIQHRKIEGKIKTCTIKRDIDQWYVSFSCEISNPVPVKIPELTPVKDLLNTDQCSGKPPYL